MIKSVGNWGLHCINLRGGWRLQMLRRGNIEVINIMINNRRKQCVNRNGGGR